MKKIWAPWRIEYIKQSRADDECFICDVINDDPINDKKNLILYRGKSVVVLLNLYPYIARQNEEKSITEPTHLLRTSSSKPAGPAVVYNLTELIHHIYFNKDKISLYTPIQY